MVGEKSITLKFPSFLLVRSTAFHFKTGHLAQLEYENAQ